MREAVGWTDPDLGAVAFPQTAVDVSTLPEPTITFKLFETLAEFQAAKTEMVKARALAKLTEEEKTALGLNPKPTG